MGENLEGPTQVFKGSSLSASPDQTPTLALVGFSFLKAGLWTFKSFMSKPTSSIIVSFGR
jgi:hypothetical protein